MNNIFSYDNPLIRGINKVVDFVCLALLWGIFSIPIITLGASTTAFYYTFNKTIRKDNGYLWNSIWSSFKLNFKQATVLWLIKLGVYVVLVLNCVAAYIFMDLLLPKFIVWMIWIVSLVIVMWTCCWTPYLAGFNDTTKTIIKNSGYIMLKNMHWSIWVLAVLAASIGVAYYYRAVILIVPAIYMAICSYIYERVFRKYSQPEEDEDVEQ